MNYTQRSPYEMYRDVGCKSAGNGRLNQVEATVNHLNRRIARHDPYFVNSLLRKMIETDGFLEVTWRKREHMEKYKKILEQVWTEKTGLKLFEHECDDCPDEYFR